MAKPHVLIVEDDKSLSDVLAYNLQDAGFEVSVARDGQDGQPQPQPQPLKGSRDQLIHYKLNYKSINQSQNQNFERTIDLVLPSSSGPLYTPHLLSLKSLNLSCR